MRKISGQAFCAALITALAACSSNQATPGAGGSGNTAGASAAGSSAAGAGAGDETAGTSSSAAGDSGSNELVGTFQVQVQADDTDPTTGLTTIVGQVGDGPIPANVVWTVTKTDGGCTLETPTVPFCKDGCGADVCVDTDVCQPYPTGHSVGDVALKGVMLSAGGTDLALKEIAKAYQPPAGTTLAYPPFAVGDDVTLHASGGDYTAFDLAAKGVDPLAFTSTDFELETGKPLALTWDAPADPKSAQMYVKLDISHHGGIKGMIECSGDDTGSLTISAPLVTELIGLGVAGFPSVVMMRESIATTKIAPGVVRLDVSSRAEHYVTVKGVDSCTTDADCPTGKTCRTTDSTCH